MITEPVREDTLRKAIELRMSDIFPAMNIANLFGGSPSPAWNLLRKHSLVDMVKDALERGLPVGEFYDQVEHKKFTECKCYPKLKEALGDVKGFPL